MTTRALATAALLLSHSILGTQAQEPPAAPTDDAQPYSGPTYTRHTSAPLPVSYEVQQLKVDGLDTVRGEMRNRVFSAYTLTPKNWVAIQLPETSLAYQGAYYPNVKWTLSLWPPKAFLPSLSPASLEGYAEGLKASVEEPEQIKILNKSFGHRSAVILSIFNRDPRTLAYEITNTETGTTTLRYDTFVMFQGYLLEFSIWGPPTEVKRMLGWFSIIPESLALTTPDPNYLQEIKSAYVDPPDTKKTYTDKNAPPPPPSTPPPPPPAS